MSLGTVPSYNFDSESLHPHDSNVSVRESSGLLLLLVYFEVVLFYIYPRIHVFLYIINPCYFSQLLSLLLVDVLKGITYHFYNAKIDVANINSQVNEQAHAGLSKLRPFLAYMRQDNFMYHIALYLALKNIRRKKQL